MQERYVCPLCNSTKDIVKPRDQSIDEFMQQLPETLPCGWRGCEGRLITEQVLNNKARRIYEEWCEHLRVAPPLIIAWEDMTREQKEPFRMAARRGLKV